MDNFSSINLFPGIGNNQPKQQLGDYQIPSNYSYDFRLPTTTTTTTVGTTTPNLNSTMTTYSTRIIDSNTNTVDPYPTSLPAYDYGVSSGSGSGSIYGQPPPPPTGYPSVGVRSNMNNNRQLTPMGNTGYDNGVGRSSYGGSGGAVGGNYYMGSGGGGGGGRYDHHNGSGGGGYMNSYNHQRGGPSGGGYRGGYDNNRPSHMGNGGYRGGYDNNNNTIMNSNNTNSNDYYNSGGGGGSGGSYHGGNMNGGGRDYRSDNNNYRTYDGTRGGGRGGYRGGGDHYHPYGNSNRTFKPPKKEIMDQSDVERSKCIFVGNLPYHYQKQDLVLLFGKFGPLTNINVGVDKRTGRSKGYAFVEFENKADANSAFEEFTIKEVNGRKLRLDWDLGIDLKKGSNVGGDSLQNPPFPPPHETVSIQIPNSSTTIPSPLTSNEHPQINVNDKSNRDGNNFAETSVVADQVSKKEETN